MYPDIIYPDGRTATFKFREQMPSDFTQQHCQQWMIYSRNFIGVPMNTLSEVLLAAWALIDHPSKWTQGCWARRSDGYNIMGDWSRASTYDSSGALRKATGALSHGSNCQFRDAYNVLETTLHRRLGRKEYLTIFNDTHSWEEVRDLWLDAITTEQQKEAAQS